MKTIPLSAVVLAAGRSSRMGRPKALLPIGGRTVLEHVVSVFHDNGLSDIQVVTGHGRSELAPVLRASGARIVENPRFNEGMFSSVLAGLDAVDGACAGVFIMPVDIPLVRPESIGRLREACRADPNALIVPTFQARPGHPPLIPAAMIPQVAAWREPGGLRAFIRASASRTIRVEVPDVHILLDLDTPEDYRHLTRRWAHRHIPTPEECEVILRSVHPTSEAVIRHGHAVARIADAMVSALAESGEALDGKLIHAAAVLHDVAKGQPSHAETGGAWLKALGFEEVGRVVASHSNPALRETGDVTSAEVLYLADKFVSGEKVVSLFERFHNARMRFGGHTGAENGIRRREDTAHRIRDRIESRIRQPIENILP
ncbi:MAG: DVU_1551 family NTP transferase [Desulfobacterales bacterium]